MSLTPVQNVRAARIPGPDHPITILRNPARVVVMVSGHVVADSSNAWTFRESTYPEVFYIPIEDVKMALLERSEHTSYCPYKGDCNYFSIPVGGSRSVDAVWTYESPFASVAPIANHLAFYPERVDSIQVLQTPDIY